MTHDGEIRARRARRGALSFALATAVAALPGLVRAEDPPTASSATATPSASEPAAPLDRRSATRAELDGVLRDMEIGRDRQAELKRDIDALERDRTRVAERLVATAARIQDLESRLATSQARVETLDGQMAGVRASLAARRGVLADVLAALQRIGRKPPPAIVVRPEDALASVRSAILVGALLPELRGRAEALLADLETLEEIKRAAAAERDRFRTEARDLVEERARHELLVEERRRTRTAQEKSLEEERRRVSELARRAAGLEALIARLDAEVPKPAAPPAGGRLASLGDAGRLEPAVAFAEARGTLPLPVAGRMVHRWGDDDGLGGTARGLTIATRDDARVTSPCDGWVVFSGPFRSYGKLLIINGGGGYHVVLAGLERIDVELGQFVLAGEPVGVMGGRRAAVAEAVATRGEQAVDPLLYVEFRKDNAAIDPTPWWARTPDEKVRG
jgi:septal ring factor EnvC (AmiA/AmiB activator)